VKVNGWRIELGEVESALSSFQGVEHAVVIVRNGQLVAYVTAVRGSSLGPNELARLRTHIGRSLTSYMMPR